MRALSVLAFVPCLAACDIDQLKMNDLFIGEQVNGMAGIRGRVDRLEAENLALKTQVSMLMAGRKQPHLVVKATGEDLGLYLGTRSVAWSEELRSIYCIGTRAAPEFAEADCRGESRVILQADACPYAPGVDGLMIEVGGAMGTFTSLSTMHLAGCQNSTGPVLRNQSSSYSATTHRAEYYPAGDLGVDVR